MNPNAALFILFFASAGYSIAQTMGCAIGVTASTGVLLFINVIRR